MKRFSILQDKKQCYFCGATENIETHEVYFGKNRKKSIEHGLCVYLCQGHHRGTNGVHGKNGHLIDQQLKQAAQAEFEAHNSREEFIRIFGRNYLED